MSEKRKPAAVVKFPFRTILEFGQDFLYPIRLTSDELVNHEFWYPTRGADFNFAFSVKADTGSSLGPRGFNQFVFMHRLWQDIT